jgi:hypothetical protein
MSDTLVEEEQLAPARRASIPARALAAGAWGALGRLEMFLDASASSQAVGARRMRQSLALLFGAYAAVLQATALRHGDFPVTPVLVAMVAVAVFIGRGGRFVHYFLPVVLGLFSYILAARFASGLHLGVHYTPQIDAERLLPGPMPTLWLQHHLYHGTTGPIEVLAVTAYVSHFAVPLLIGFGIAMAGRARAFTALMFGLLVTSLLGEITFILAPTAPPWLAAQDGYLPPVDHILKTSLYDLHLTQLANVIGDRGTYDVTAAIPSLHVAFPVVCLLTALTYRLPRWLVAAIVVNCAAVVFAVVYTGDHYIVDAIAGAVYALLAWWVVRRFLGPEPADATP